MQPDVLQDLQTVAVRQVDVADHRVESPVFGQLDGRPPVLGERHDVARGLKKAGHGLGKRGIVIHHEDVQTSRRVVRDRGLLRAEFVEEIAKIPLAASGASSSAVS